MEPFVHGIWIQLALRIYLLKAYSYLAIKETLHKYHIPIENLLSFTSDTCNVMKGAKGGVIAKIQVEQPKVVDIKCVMLLTCLSNQL